MLDKSELDSRAKKIKLLVLDVDGILTDGRLFFGSDGSEYKAFNTLDGHGIKLLRSTGVRVGIITGRTSALTERRAKDLQIDCLIQGREDKFVALQEMLTHLQQTQGHTLQLEDIAFMGDDLPDLLVMTRVGLALTALNGHEAVVAQAHWQSTARGGEGAVREACDLLMKTQGTYQDVVDRYLQ